MLQKFFSLFNKKIKLRPAIQEKSDIQRVEDIFQELQDIKRKNERLTKYLKRIQRQQQDLKKYKSLTKEDYEKVTKLLGQYKNIIEQRKLMEGRLIRNNPALRIIQIHEKEVPELIQEIRKTENNQHLAQRDMLYLEDEKNYLYNYRESLITGYRVLKIVTVALIAILGVAGTIILTMVQTLRENTFIISSIISIITLFFVFAILTFKRRIEYELEKNEAMQQKAVKLLNRTKMRYFHHTNYLNFQYNKFKITNADQLQGQYNRYLKNKNNEVYYKNMNKQLDEVENSVFDILYETGMERDVFDNLDQWVEMQNIEKLLEDLKIEYNHTHKQLEALSAYEQDLFKEAYIIAETSPELASTVASLINRNNT